MASVLTDSVPEVLYLSQANPTLLRVELDVRAAAPNLHLAVVVEKLLLGLTEDDNVVEVALNSYSMSARTSVAMMR